MSVRSHTCHVSDMHRVRNMVQSIPTELRPKLALALLREHQADISPQSNSSVKLPQVQGGVVTVTIGKVSTKQQAEISKLSLKEVQMMSSKAHLTGVQQQSILADIRSKWGKNSVDPGLKKSIPAHNMKFAKYFRVEKKQFETSSGDLVEKALFYCHNVEEFLREVDVDREKVGVAQLTVIQGDSGQQYTKVSVSRVNQSDLEEKNLKRINGAGLTFGVSEEVLGNTNNDKKRRSREEGIGGGDQFEDWGSRKLLLLALVHKVPENSVQFENNI